MAADMGIRVVVDTPTPGHSFSVETVMSSRLGGKQKLSDDDQQINYVPNIGMIVQALRSESSSTGV